MKVYFLPAVEKITVGIFEDREGKIFQAGERYPAIALSYSDEITLFLVRLMIELNVSEKDLFLVNFEKLKENFNIAVCFKIKRGIREIVLMAETEMNDKSVNDFKKYFQKTKRFIICFGLFRPDDIISLAAAWYIVCYDFTDYDGKSLLSYLGGQYH